MTRPEIHRHTEYRLIMTVIGVVCGLAAVGSVVPHVEHLTGLGFVGAGGLVALVGGVRLAARFVRERLEDAADARTAAAWRAAHGRTRQEVA